MNDLVTPLLWAATISAGLIGGLTLGLGGYVANALADLERKTAAAALHALARAQGRSAFAILLVLGGIASAALLLLSVPEILSEPSDAPLSREVMLRLLGAAGFLFAVVSTSMVLSRVMIQSFARLVDNPQAPFWDDAVRGWIIYNLIRMLGAIMSMTCFVGSLAARIPP